MNSPPDRLAQLGEIAGLPSGGLHPSPLSQQDTQVNPHSNADSNARQMSPTMQEGILSPTQKYKLHTSKRMNAVLTLQGKLDKNFFGRKPNQEEVVGKEPLDFKAKMQRYFEMKRRGEDMRSEHDLSRTLNTIITASPNECLQSIVEANKQINRRYGKTEKSSQEKSGEDRPLRKKSSNTPKAGDSETTSKIAGGMIFRQHKNLTPDTRGKGGEVSMKQNTDNSVSDTKKKQSDRTIRSPRETSHVPLSKTSEHRSRVEFHQQQQHRQRPSQVEVRESLHELEEKRLALAEQQKKERMLRNQSRKTVILKAPHMDISDNISRNADSNQLNESFGVSSINPPQKGDLDFDPSDAFPDELPLPDSKPTQVLSKRNNFRNATRSRNAFFTSMQEPKKMQSYLREMAKNSNNLQML
jgi:hypothetical protein